MAAACEHAVATIDATPETVPMPRALIIGGALRSFFAGPHVASLDDPPAGGAAPGGALVPLGAAPCSAPAPLGAALGVALAHPPAQLLNARALERRALELSATDLAVMRGCPACRVRGLAAGGA